MAVDLVDDVTELVLRCCAASSSVRMGAVGLDVSLLLLFVILFVIRSALGC